MKKIGSAKVGKNKTKVSTSHRGLSLSSILNLSAFNNLPKGIFAISLFGLFLGASTTMIYSQLGLFLKNELHATELRIAVIDGIVEFIAYVTRVFSGVISDYFMNRKFILYVGCIITLFMKPVFAIAQSPLVVMIAQAIERIGNGLQATPRDALIADLSTPLTRGQSFGFSKSFKTIGSLLGTSIAITILVLSGNNYRLVFACATIAVVIAILCLSKIKTKEEIQQESDKAKVKIINPFQKQYLKSFDSNFWKLIIFAILLELGHFSEALFPIYANNFVAASIASSVSMFISIGQVTCSFPIGLYADRLGKKKFLKVCIIMMILANISFMSATSIYQVYIGAFLWGGQMTANQGLFLSILMERIDTHLRGTAIGIYYCAIGAAYLIASTIAGKIWETESLGSMFAFLYSIVWCVISLIFFKILVVKTEHKS
ncbi:MAG: MFS transporter [Alphaproteobacteria bacterium]|nr:MFS transporter [Alphaproteobacteria bacterium]